MPSVLNPYIHFKNNARQAMEFYQSVFGGKLTMSTFKEFQMSPDPSQDDNIMHAQLEADNGITLMGSDTPDSMPYNPGTSITISHLDLDDLSNPHEAYRLENDGADEHHLTHVLLEQHAHVLGADEHQRDRECRRQRQQHVPCHAPVRGVDAHLTEDLEPLPNDMGEVVENL